MIPILIKLAISAVCGVLDTLGGIHWLWMRRYLMPAIIGISVAIFLGIWWAVFLPLPVMGTLCIGYKNDGNFGRAVWMGLQTIAIGLGLFLTGHLAWFLWLPFVIVGFFIGGVYRTWLVGFGDFAEGFYLGLILFLIK